MGTKRELAREVSRVIASAQPGILLDAFAGMGAVAQAVGSSRNVWLNDAQRFAQLTAKCNFTAAKGPPPPKAVDAAWKASFNRNIDRIVAMNSELIEQDAAVRGSSEWIQFSKGYEKLLEIQAVETDYSCFLTRYGRGFFSVYQAAEIDSIRCAIDDAKKRGDIGDDQWGWSIVSLGRACLKAANTPGHFAQYLSPSERNYKRVRKQWNRSIWQEWLDGLNNLSPTGTAKWRKSNIVTNKDCLELLDDPFCKNAKVVYCDPPYTNDHYSRYYHVWETLVDYDYPEVTGAGRYRPDRFATPFSLKTQVVNAMDSLIKKISLNGADMVLSYPSNGLIYETGNDPIDLLVKYFSKVSVECDIDHNHSTFGASKGSAKSAVRERIYLASNS